MIHPSLDFPWYIYVWICNDTPKSGFHVILMSTFYVTPKSGFSMIHLLLVLACSTQVWFCQKFKIPCYTYFWIAMLYPSLGYLLLFHLLWGTYFCFIQFWGIQFCAPQTSIPPGLLALRFFWSAIRTPIHNYFWSADWCTPNSTPLHKLDWSANWSAALYSSLQSILPSALQSNFHSKI